MSDSRRKVITTGLAAAAGVAGLDVAAGLASRFGFVPPDAGNLFRWRELSYATRDCSRRTPAREYSRDQISRSRMPTPSIRSQRSLRRCRQVIADWRSWSRNGRAARVFNGRTQGGRRAARSRWWRAKGDYIADGARPAGACSRCVGTRPGATSSTSPSSPTGTRASTWTTPRTRNDSRIRHERRRPARSSAARFACACRVSSATRA